MSFKDLEEFALRADIVVIVFVLILGSLSILDKLGYWSW